MHNLKLELICGYNVRPRKCAPGQLMSQDSTTVWVSTKGTFFLLCDEST